MAWVQLGVWGDSLVHGGCDTEMGGWVNRLRLYLAGRGLGDHCFNLGLGGQNSTEVLARIGAEVGYRSGHIDYVLVSVGINDLTYDIKLTTPAQYRENIEGIIACVREHGKTLHLLSLTPCRDVDFDKLAAMNETLYDLAQRYQTGWIDLRTAYPTDDLVDRVHPGAAGHEKIFRTVRDALIAEGIIPAEAT